MGKVLIPASNAKQGRLFWHSDIFGMGAPCPPNCCALLVLALALVPQVMVSNLNDGEKMGALFGRLDSLQREASSSELMKQSAAVAVAVLQSAGDD
jgi:hypothetical protein